MCPNINFEKCWFICELWKLPELFLIYKYNLQLFKKVNGEIILKAFQSNPFQMQDWAWSDYIRHSYHESWLKCHCVSVTGAVKGFDCSDLYDYIGVSEYELEWMKSERSLSDTLDLKGFWQDARWAGVTSLIDIGWALVSNVMSICWHCSSLGLN